MYWRGLSPLLFIWPWEADGITMPILQMRKLRPRERISDWAMVTQQTVELEFKPRLLGAVSHSLSTMPCCLHLQLKKINPPWKKEILSFWHSGIWRIKLWMFIVYFWAQTTQLAAYYSKLSAKIYFLKNHGPLLFRNRNKHPWFSSIRFVAVYWHRLRHPFPGNLSNSISEMNSLGWTSVLQSPFSTKILWFWADDGAVTSS